MTIDTDWQIRRGCGPWEDWEDDGGFDDESSLMGIIIPERSVIFQERPWYYEKKRSILHKPVPFGMQQSFL